MGSPLASRRLLVVSLFYGVYVFLRGQQNALTRSMPGNAKTGETSETQKSSYGSMLLNIFKLRKPTIRKFRGFCTLTSLA